MNDTRGRKSEPGCSLGYPEQEEGARVPGLILPTQGGSTTPLPLREFLASLGIGIFLPGEGRRGARCFHPSPSSWASKGTWLSLAEEKP